MITDMSPDRKLVNKLRHPIATAKLVITAQAEHHLARRSRQKPHRWINTTSNGSE
jgi:hypothetical protein